MRSLRMMMRSVFALICAALALAPIEAGAAWQVWFSASVVGVVGGQGGTTTTIRTIQPSAAWSQTADSGNATAGSPPVVAMNPSVAVPNGQRNILAVSSDNGRIQLTLDAAPAVTVGEQWFVSGTGVGADGFWKILPIDATHVDLCYDIQGSDPSYTCTGSTYASIMTAGGTLGYIQKVVAGLDEYPYAWIEDTSRVICVGAATGTRAGITGVDFYLEGTVVTVTQQSISPTYGTRGYCINPQSPPGKDGDAALYARAYAANGFDRVLRLPLTLNTNGSIARATTYVNCSAGSGGTGTAANPYPTIQKALFNVADGGKISIVVPPTPVTFTTGASTTVNAPGHSVIPGGRVTFSGGTLPAGINANQAYYVLLDNFSANSFQISDRPNGLNTPLDRDTNGNVVSFPLATSGPSSGVSMYGATCMDDQTGGSGRNNARMVTVTPDHIGAVTISRAQKQGTDSNGVTYRPAWTNPLARIELVGVTLDMTKEVYFQYGGTGSGYPGWFTIKNAVANSAKGANPPFGVDSVNLDGTSNTLLIGGFVTNAGSALTESVSNMQSPSGGTLYRNVKSWNSFDSYSVGFGSNNSASFNLETHKHGRMMGRNTYLETTTVASAPVYNSAANTTSFQIANYGAYRVPSAGSTAWQVGGDDYVVFYGINDVTNYHIVAADGPSQTLTVSGNLSNVPVGTHILAGGIAHGDQFQVTAWNTCPAITVENVYMQRRMSLMDYPAFESYQGQLGQSGGCAVTSGNDLTVSNAGRTVTFTNPVNLIGYTAIGLPADANGAHAARTPASLGPTPVATTTVTMAAPFPGIASGTFSRYVINNIIKDVAVVDSSGDANGLCSYEGSIINWLYLNSTYTGCSFLMRDQSSTPNGSTFYAENIVMLDSIVTQFGGSNNIVPMGLFNDNDWAMNFMVAGTNVSTGALTLDATRSAEGTARKLRAGVPLANPWDYYGNPRVPGVTSIGAVN